MPRVHGGAKPCFHAAMGRVLGDPFRLFGNYYFQLLRYLYNSNFL